MNKTDLTAKVAEKLAVSNAKAGDAVDAVLGAIEVALCRGETVTIPSFGKFDLMQSAARTGHNPKTMAPLNIPAKTAIKFRPATNLKEAVNAPLNM